MNRVYDLHRLNGFYILNTKPVLKFSGLKKYYSTGSIEKDNFEYVTYENRPSRANLQPEEGCLIFAKMSNTAKTIYIDNELKENIYSTGFFSIKPKNINYEYLFYLLECTEFLQEKDSYSNGTTQFSINENNLKKIKVHLTTFKDEQTRIVKAIKAKEEKINALITNEEKQIEKLKAYKQALISEVVTKGLDPNVPMKDSGVEWIGKIPYDWRISKIKFCADIFGRIGFRGYTESDLVSESEAGAITLSPTNFNNMKMNYSKVTYLSWHKYYESPEIMIENGDVLFVKTGSSYGKSSLVVDLPKEATINPQLIVFKNIKQNKKMFSYIIQSQSVKFQTELIVTGGTIPTMSQEKIKNFIIVDIPTFEQKEIVNFLDSKCGFIDSIIDCHNSKIEKLKQYRQSMIYEYVTGKRKVY